MASPKAARCGEQHKVKTSTESSEPPSILSCPEQTSSAPRLGPVAGQKRQRSPSPPGTHRKRQLLPAEAPPDLNPREPLRLEDNWHCFNCGLPCWRCHSSSKPRTDLPSLHEKEASEPESMEPPSRSTSVCSTPSSNKRRKYEESGIKYVGPKDADFEKCILNPCGVSLDGRKPSNLMCTDIFGTQSSNPPSRVFIHKDQEELQEIIEDFIQYGRRRYDEQALSTICNDSIILRDRHIYNDLFNDTHVIKSVRREKWKPRKQGPPVPGGTHTYDWDIEPDATYAVSIRMFGAEDRRKLQSKSWERWLAEDNAVCPYLTIEYKCSEKTGKKSHAMYQNAAASMLWLYQRKQIRDALAYPLDDLRHYSITVFDAAYHISEARFRDSCYEISTLAHGDLTQMDGLENYIDWSNAIHAWGLGPNASSFKENIKKLLERERSTQPFPTPQGTHPPMSGSAPTPPAS